MVHLNYVAIVVAAVAGHFLGALWYSPILFGKAWMNLSGFTKQKVDEMKKSGMAKSYIVSFIGTLVTSFVLACAIARSGAALQPLAGASMGFWCWLGFVAPVILGAILWEGKPFGLFGINAGYYLASLVIIGGILAAWPAKAQTDTQAIAFAVPIVSGKTEAWKKFIEEVNGPRNMEYGESRKRAGAVVERIYLQQSPQGDMAIVYVQGANVRNFCHVLGASQDPFDIWFREQVLDVHGMDLAKELPPSPQQVVDWTS